MSQFNWDDYYDDNDIYSDTHEIEVEHNTTADLDDLLLPLNTPDPELKNDINSRRQKSLHDYFKGGKTHVAQSRRGKYHQKKRAPRRCQKKPEAQKIDF